MAINLDDYKKNKKKTDTSANVSIEDYINKSGSQDTYQAQLQQLQQAKNTAQQQNYVAYQTMMKYLPQMNKASGVYGLGVSGSNAIDLQNNYVQGMGQAQTNYDLAKTNLLEQYRQEQKADQSDYYSALKSKIAQGQYFTNADLNKYLEDAKANGLTEKQLADLYSDVEYAKKADVDALATNEELAKDPVTGKGVTFKSNRRNLKMVAGDNIALQDASGKTINVESGGEVDDANVLRKAQGVQDGEVFGYNSQVYYKVNGKVYLIQGRSGNASTKDYTALYNIFFGN